jgi:plasmid maintenance system antidote protein VapI
VNLRDYLYHNRISVTEFAKNIDYSRGHLTSIINGKLRPSKKLARQIEKATNGEVKAEELLNEKQE